MQEEYFTCEAEAVGNAPDHEAEAVACRARCRHLNVECSELSTDSVQMATG